MYVVHLLVWVINGTRCTVHTSKFISSVAKMTKIIVLNFTGNSEDNLRKTIAYAKFVLVT